MSALFGPGREGFLDGTINWGATPVIKASLIRSYTFNSAHRYVSEVIAAGGSLVSPQSAAFTSKTVTNGVADAAALGFATVTAGIAIPAMIIYQASAVSGGADVAQSAQRLICHIDTATGLPVTPNGQNITVAFDNGANRIFVL
jgi:hypothetical protein